MTIRNSQIKILVADDDAQIRNMLERFLAQRGFVVTVCESGAVALEQAAMELPDVILLDVNMPEMDGFEVCRQLRSNLLTAHLAVVFFTAIDSPAREMQAFKDDLGDDYIVKPVEMQRLSARLIHLAGLTQQRAMASCDTLTGAWNRRFFETLLQRQAAETARNGKNFAVAMIDIDHFKAVNDTYGHPAGDAVLQQLVSVIRVAIRNTDYLCRYGGEEFVVVMPRTEPAAALLVAERMRAAVENTDFPRVGKCTVSIGVAVGSDGQRVLHRADEALYAAKKGGRNQVKGGV